MKKVILLLSILLIAVIPAVSATSQECGTCEEKYTYGNPVDCGDFTTKYSCKHGYRRHFCKWVSEPCEIPDDETPAPEPQPETELEINSEKLKESEGGDSGICLKGCGCGEVNLQLLKGQVPWGYGFNNGRNYFHFPISVTETSPSVMLQLGQATNSVGPLLFFSPANYDLDGDGIVDVVATLTENYGGGALVNLDVIC